jgi:predicted amidohydrolase
VTGQIRVAVAAWKLRKVKSDGGFLGHFHDIVSRAHEEGADLLVVPENHTLELLNLAHDLEERDVPAFLAQFADELEAWIARISQSSGMLIIGGSHLRQTPEGFQNVCTIGHPSKGVVRLAKNKLTVYERDVWRLTPGQGLRTLPDPRVGALICYDSEFPEAARVLAESGIGILAIPAFTETQRGFLRVRWSAQARAVENQIYVLHSSLVGSLYREPVPTTAGTAAIIAPSVEPFPDNPILAESEPNEEAVLVRSLDLDQLAGARRSGDVRNWQDRDAANWVLDPETVRSPES